MNLLHWGSWLYLCRGQLKLTRSTSTNFNLQPRVSSFLMDTAILIQRCRSTHLYSLCDRRLFVTVYVLCIMCVSHYATRIRNSYAGLRAQIATKSKTVPAEEG